MMKLRLATPERADRHRPGRASWRASSTDGDDLVIGATTRHADLAASALVRAEAPLLAHAAAQVGDPQIRHRGTIGGSLAHADPAADLPMALVALGGSVVLRGPRRRPHASARTTSSQGYFETALEPDELLTAVRVPGAPGQPVGLPEVHPPRQRLGDRRGRGGRRPDRAGQHGPDAAARPGGRGRRWPAGPAPAEAAALAAEGTSPGEDMHADRDYRRHLARVLTRRALDGQAG